MNNHKQNNFLNDIKSRLANYIGDHALQCLANDILDQMNHRKYAYNFHWLGRPIIQIPQDTVTFQEMIWEVKPDCIIETGIAHGGSLIFSASMMAVLETCQIIKNPLVIGIDIDIRPENRLAIETHPLFKYIKMIESSSISSSTIELVANIVKSYSRVMVFLDSNHTHEHVLAELNAYSPLVSTGSFCIILDTGIEDIDPKAIAAGRTWCKGNSPKSALNEFLLGNKDFVLDDFYHQKAIVTSCPNGIIKRVS